MPPKSCSVEVGPPAPKGEGRARRHYLAYESLVATPAEGCATVYDVLQRSAK
jgi:hypothetical protein